MKEILLTQEKVALVDDEDFEYLSKFVWYAMKNGNTFYAVRNSKCTNGKRTTICMHCEIMGSIGIDHIDHDGINNQKLNLRVCTHSNNLMNRRKWGNTSSKFKGVNFDKRSGKWRVQIMANWKRTCIGYFTSEDDAARAFDAKAKELHGEFAYLNFTNE